MRGILRGLAQTFRSHWRRPVTIEYPDVKQEKPPRFSAIPALIWDHDLGEPFCTGCQVCMRNCPTDAIVVTMMDNPLAAEGKSKRRKTVDVYEIDVSRCITCGTCVEVCNFDALEMSFTHELAAYAHREFIKDKHTLFEYSRSKRESL